ncbi:nitric oxide-associated protein 1 isoform 1-T1 [Menidia menidia]
MLEVLRACARRQLWTSLGSAARRVPVDRGPGQTRTRTGIQTGTGVRGSVGRPDPSDPGLTRTGTGTRTQTGTGTQTGTRTQTGTGTRSCTVDPDQEEQFVFLDYAEEDPLKDLSRQTPGGPVQDPSLLRGTRPDPLIQDLLDPLLQDPAPLVQVQDPGLLRETRPAPLIQDPVPLTQDLLDPLVQVQDPGLLRKTRHNPLVQVNEPDPLVQNPHPQVQEPGPLVQVQDPLINDPDSLVQDPHPLLQVQDPGPLLQVQDPGPLVQVQAPGPLVQVNEPDPLVQDPHPLLQVQDPGPLFQDAHPLLHEPDPLVQDPKPMIQVHEPDPLVQDPHPLLHEPDPLVQVQAPGRCPGCGVLLQGVAPGAPGFLPGFPAACRPGATCRRCHGLTHYRRAPGLRPAPESYRAAVRRLRPEPGLVLLVVDLLDLPDSIVPDLPGLVGADKRVVVVGNKVDLLPPDAPDYLRRLRLTLARFCQEAGFEGQVAGVHLVSARTGYGVEPLVSSLMRLGGGGAKGGGARGHVFLVGTANAGKSSLFNTLLQSDLCKTHAAVPKATVSPWPGTTLSLLRFPLLNPTPYRLLRRRRRLLEEEQQEAPPQELRRLQLLRRHGYLVGRVGHTFRAGASRTDEVQFDPDSLAFGEDEEPEESTPRPPAESHDGLSWNELKDVRWLLDTPGILRQQDVLELLQDQEVQMVVPTRALVPRTFVLKPGMTLFVGALARIDFLEGGKSCSLSVLASSRVPVRVTGLEKADELYAKHAGHALLGVPAGGAQRMQDFPALAPRDIWLEGRGHQEAAADITLSSAGWVAVATAEGQRLLLRVHGPPGAGYGLRTPPLLPYAHRALNAPPDAHRALNAPPDAHRALNAPPHDHRALNAPPDAHRALNAPPHDHRAMNAPPDAQRVLKAAPDTQRALKAVPDAGRTLKAPAQAQRALNAPPHAHRAMNAPPDTQRALKAVPDAGRTLKAPAQAQRALNAPPHSQRTLKAAPDAHRTLKASQGAQKLPFRKKKKKDKKE